MANYNKVMLMGNLTRDPELRYTANGTAVCNVGIAINRQYRNKEGATTKETTFVDCEAFGRTAEVMNEYLSKGRPVFIEGRLKLDQWQDKDGRNRSKLRVVVESFQFIDSNPDERQESVPEAARRQREQSRTRTSNSHEPITEDDTPW